MSDNRNRLCIMTGAKDLLDEPEPKTLCGHKMGRWYDHRREEWCWDEAVFEDAGEAIRNSLADTKLGICETCAEVAIDALKDLKEIE